MCVDRSSYSRLLNTTLTFLQPQPKITHTLTHWYRGRWTWNRWLKIHVQSVWAATVSKYRQCHNSIQQSHSNTLSKHTHRNLHMVRSLIVLFMNEFKEIFIVLLKTVKHNNKMWNILGPQGPLWWVQPWLEWFLKDHVTEDQSLVCLLSYVHTH